MNDMLIDAYLHTVPRQKFESRRRPKIGGDVTQTFDAVLKKKTINFNNF
jgi:hypothetical protein